MTNAKQLLATAFDLDPAEVPDNADMSSFRPWDSLGHMKIVAEVEARIGRAVTTEELLEITDLASLEKLLGGSVAR